MDNALLLAGAYFHKHKIKKFNRETSEEYIARVVSIITNGLWKKKNRITAMKNNVPKTKEKTNAEYAIPVAAQEEWNPMHGLKTVRPTSILVVKYQGAEVGRYLCLYRDVGYAGQDRTEIYPEHSCTVTTYLCRKLTPSATTYNSLCEVWSSGTPVDFPLKSSNVL